MLSAKSDSDIAAASKSSPLPERDISASVDRHVSINAKIVGRLWDLERLWLSEFPSFFKKIVLAILCLATITSVSIAAFFIARGDQNSDPAPSRVRSDVLSRTTVAVAAAADESPDSFPSSDSQPLPAAPTAVAITGPHPVTGQSQVAEPLDDALDRENTETAKVLIENMPAELPSRVHAINRQKAHAPRRYVEVRRRIRQQVPPRHPQSGYYGQTYGSDSIDFGRGHSYGGPAPYSDIGG